MKFQAIIVLLGAVASPILASAVPNGDNSVRSSDDAELLARADIFARKTCSGTCNENGCHCTNPVRVCSCSKDNIGKSCKCK
ncbi:uncharacterized protein MAM_01055 [Metarhizium album ARSEF 1941]|uniref:Uncharacterized protein n=1 Tax=Metarhizium album (strain ARSEF 1941) TaxID=1081103 RepID=A0A0B2X6N6_METAS|nr:uncharacterized protein MAM_01055 [Metarhizium album ARSEF 1941]KHO02054.1 hypothetical protein MAM_01055 [Metarhizium album ARSEF 1941]